MRLNRILHSIALLALGASLAFSQLSLRPAIQTTRPTAPDQGNMLLGREEQPAEKKSMVLAIAYSLVLPGLGDLYADNFRTGRYFMGADAALWVTYTGFRVRGNWLKEDARSFAAERAGANFDGKGSQFEVDLGNFLSTQDYNEAKLRNREYDLLYDPNSTFAWHWGSEADKALYKDLRIRGDEVLRNSQFVVGFLVLNRVLSAISAARSVTLYNRNVQVLGSWRINANVQGSIFAAHGVEVRLTREF